MVDRISELEAELWLEKTLSMHYFEKSNDMAEENLRLERRITGLKHSRNSLKSKFDQERKRNSQLAKRINELVINVSILEETIMTLNSRIEDGMERENKGLKETIEWQKIQNDGMTKNRNKLKADLKEMTELRSNAVVAKSQLLDPLHSKIESLEVQVSGLREELAFSRHKYDLCYRYIVTQSKHRSEAASKELDDIEFGQYPWEKS